MKKMRTALVLLGLSLPVMAQALEFQTPGTLGMGRAGVARTTDAYATFINPAGLAFYEKAFSMKLGAGVGVAISSSLADNMDKIGKLDLSNTNMNYTNASEAIAATTRAAQFASVLTDLSDKKGNLAVNVDLSLGFRYRNFGLGLFGASEVGAGIGSVDLVNIRAGNATTTTSVSQLFTDIGAVAGSSTGAASYFSQTEYDKTVSAFQAAGATSQQQARDLVSTIETKLKNGGNTTGMTPDQVAQGLQLLAPSLGGTGGSIDNNTTKVLLRGIAIVEVPFAYGHKFDLGSFGKLGIGGAAKVMQGTVYSTDYEVMKLKDSNDATTKAKDNHSESTQLGLDLGVLWRLEPVSVGLALKNLNSPKFDGPKDPVSGASAGKIKVEPQARLGVAYDPLSWLALAVDMDLTKNKTILPGRDSQLIGGGLEAYASWIAGRLGLYKNIGETGSKPVITAGFSIGPKWLSLDVNGAFATEKGTYDNKSYPNEAKVEFGIGSTF
jgi:hypothetical protein